MSTCPHTHPHMHTFTHIHTHTHTNPYIHIYTDHIYTHSCTCTTSTHTPHTHAHARTHTHTHTHSVMFPTMFPHYPPFLQKFTIYYPSMNESEDRNYVWRLRIGYWSIYTYNQYSQRTPTVHVYLGSILESRNCGHQ